MTVALHFDAVTVRLGGRTVVRGVSLEVAAGEVVGLVGPNGSGKSSLLRCAYRQLTPHRGTVRVGGRDVASLRRMELARHLAVVPQDQPVAFDLSVAEVVALGRLVHGDRTSDDGAVLEALAHVELAHLADRPFPLLSGGERQRVLVARAFAQDASHIVLDEPTNHLDVRHQLAVLEQVRHPDRAVVAALHDLNLAAAHCDRLAVLHDGRLVACGPPATVLTTSLVREVYGVDAAVVEHDCHHQVLLTGRVCGGPSASERPPATVGSP